MATEVVPLNQIGYKILITLVEDNAVVPIDTATVKQIAIWKPDGSTITGEASFETDGSDGQLFYKTIDGDLDVEDWYVYRAYVELPSGFKGYSDKGQFQVSALS